MSISYCQSSSLSRVLREEVSHRSFFTSRTLFETPTDNITPSNLEALRSCNGPLCPRTRARGVDVLGVEGYTNGCCTYTECSCNWNSKEILAARRCVSFMRTHHQMNYHDTTKGSQATVGPMIVKSKRVHNIMCPNNRSFHYVLKLGDAQQSVQDTKPHTKSQYTNDVIQILCRGGYELILIQKCMQSETV